VGQTGATTSWREAGSICAVLPSFNEAENLPSVVGELADILDGRFARWQILVVDDGSTDNTSAVLGELQQEQPGLQSIKLRRNSGKSDALQAAFSRVDADLILLMDADGQDDPTQLPAMLAEIDAGADLVTGRRQIRRDRFAKRTTSRLFNWTSSRLSGVPGSDFNSGFKLLRKEVAQSVRLYGELHRYIPVLAAWAGFRIAEVDVNHRARLGGTSKFGRNRFWRGLFDLFTVKFITTYDRRPFHLIGGAGLVIGLVGAVLLTWMLIERLSGDAVGTRPALLAGVMLTVVGVQLVSVGLLAELMVHLHHSRGESVPPIED
jgi:dolichol-phosphate mannosyltransferase